MMDYFSSLIKQTGITIRADGESNSVVPESPAVRSEKLDKTTPIHLMDEKEVESRTDISIGKIHEDEAEGFTNRDSHTEGKDIHHIEEEDVIEHQTDVSVGDTPEDVKVGLKHPQLYDGCDKFYEILFEKDGTAESESHEYRKNLPPKQGINLNNQLTREQIWKAIFKEVRSWAAETPDEDIGELYKNGTFKTTDSIGAESGAPSLPDQILSSMSSEQGHAEQQETEKPEINDLHLSIGTISLIIEGPQKEIQSYKPVQIRKDERPIKESGFSRLSRHYIRI